MIDDVPFFNIDIIQLLLEHGADINLVDAKGNTPTYYAGKAELDLEKLLKNTS